jgi:hypothetical protein
MLFIFLEIRLIGVAWRGGSIYQEIPPFIITRGIFLIGYHPLIGQRSKFRDQSLRCNQKKRGFVRTLSQRVIGASADITLWAAN